MGGLGPGIGGLEYLVIGIVALVVVGPERLPGMLRQLGKMVAKARGMANEFRASFEDMARQSELDELRKEVQALRDGQGPVGQGMVRLGDEANAAFKDIKAELEAPAYVEAPPRAVMLDQPEFPEPALAVEVAAPVKTPKPKTKARGATESATTASSKPRAETAVAKAGKPRAPRKPKTAP
ncbi:Sec-independent protein translocase protein TatB [Brevundimonas sp. NIBR11]|uniref:Sec-independent protein translocase protein TatB n=1 Tax=Brevundimonas sp. NIBR11 TaxID=3015999 RepID=UPI0022EFDB3B|nr:Sec-independent protein translocase protein TatB [Brevundimonas sp. NIBR11]WGM31027.1 Sec-independent protein translocase protein TatB [Brevundimonas sp. NIBR11]